MVKRFLLVALAMHVLFALVWWLVIDVGEERRFEHEAVRITITIAFLAYAVLVVAYWRARKTRLNTALAVNKAYWALVIGVLFLPRLWWDTGWAAPGWLRVYLWAGLAVSIIGVLVEFYVANWGEPKKPPIDPHPDQLIAQRMAAPPRADA